MILNYKNQGQGEPVLLIHGLFGSLTNLGVLGKHLSEHYSVYLLDMRNHGDTPHSDLMDYPSMAHDVVQFMEDQEIETAHILGHYMGGKIAMQVAMNYPHKVHKLAVADIAPVNYESRHDEVLQGLSAIDLDSLKSRSAADEVLRNYVEEPDVRSFLLKNLTRNPAGGYQWKINLTGIHSNYRNITFAPTGDTFNGPTLFIKGANSDYIDSRHRETILKLFPNLSLKVIDAGHWLHAEKPALFNRLVLKFLQENHPLAIDSIRP